MVGAQRSIYYNGAMARYFTSRDEAAGLLLKKLAAYRGQHPLVLAIPRGAVPMGRRFADALGGDLDVVLVRKIGAPMNPEFAVAAVDEAGGLYVTGHAAGAGATPEYLEQARQEAVRILGERRRQYGQSTIDPAGRTAIVVDDGLATGATMITALRAVRARGPARLVCAVPVAAPDTLEAIRSLADDVVCYQAPENFHAVGQFYLDFPQIGDDQVRDALMGNKG